MVQKPIGTLDADSHSGDKGILSVPELVTASAPGMPAHVINNLWLHIGIKNIAQQKARHIDALKMDNSCLKVIEEVLLNAF